MANSKRRIKKTIPNSRPQIRVPRWVVVSVLALIICVAAAVRLRLLDMPLERDEGEYAYTGQLMLQGIPPYKLAYNMKLPGTYATYAVIMAVFGQTTRGIHLGLIIVNAATILLVYFLGRKLFGQICGLVAAATFALLSLSHSVLGLSAHATHFVTLFGLAGFLLTLRATEDNRLRWFFVSGLLFGVAFVMKQAGVFLGLFGGLFLLWHEWRRQPQRWPAAIKRLGIFSAGAILPFALTCIALGATGVFDQFRFWTFSYAREYVTQRSISEGWVELQDTSSHILAAAPVIWLLTGVGIFTALFNRTTRRAGGFAVGLLLAALATTIPGFYFRQHYFITVLPAAALLVGVAMQNATEMCFVRSRSRYWLLAPWSLLLVSVCHFLVQNWAIFVRLSPHQATRRIFGPDPFPEAVELGNYIREHSKPEVRIAVIGSEPEIYFYSQRHSATGYIYMYPLMEPQPFAASMQQQMIKEIEEAKPEFVVFVRVESSWLQQKDSHQDVLKWIPKYVEAEFQATGFADIQSADRTVYRWGDNAIAAIPRAPNYVLLFKRPDAL